MDLGHLVITKPNTSSLPLQHLCTADMKWMMDGASLCCSPIRQTEMFCFHGVLVSSRSFHFH